MREVNVPNTTYLVYHISNNKHSCRNRPSLLDKFITDLNNNFNGFMLLPIVFDTIFCDHLLIMYTSINVLNMFKLRYFERNNLDSSFISSCHYRDRSV